MIDVEQGLRGSTSASLVSGRAYLRLTSTEAKLYSSFFHYTDSDLIYLPTDKCILIPTVRLLSASARTTNHEEK